MSDQGNNTAVADENQKIGSATENTPENANGEVVVTLSKPLLIGADDKPKSEITVKPPEVSFYIKTGETFQTVTTETNGVSGSTTRDDMSQVMKYMAHMTGISENDLQDLKFHDFLKVKLAVETVLDPFAG